MIRIVNLTILLLGLPLLFSCALEPQTNRYQLPIEPDLSARGAVAELQKSAFRALDHQDYQQAIDYLQRAIRIKPRDPISWHYLALTYWRSGDLKRCAEMVERSFSYSEAKADLDYANQRLREKCRRG